MQRADNVAAGGRERLRDIERERTRLPIRERREIGIDDELIDLVQRAIAHVNTVVQLAARGASRQAFAHALFEQDAAGRQGRDAPRDDQLRVREAQPVDAERALAGRRARQIWVLLTLCDVGSPQFGCRTRERSKSSFARPYI